MSLTSHLAELDLLRRQVADLARELTERDQTFREQNRQLDDELIDLREQSEMLRAIVTGTAAETGEDFFQTLVFHLSSVLGVRYAIVGEVQHGPIKKIRTVAVSAGGVPVDNFEYPLLNTPCGTALGQSFACFERDVQRSFPAFERLTQLNVEGYCGVPLRAKGGAVTGLLVVMDTKPLRNTERLKSIMAVFASRAGAELQRRQVETKLNQQQRQLIEAQALAHLGSWDWDIDSGNVQWSEEQWRIFGYEPGAITVTHDTFLTALYPDDHDRVLGAINDALTGRAIYDIECRIVRPHGEIRAIHCRGEVLRDETGRPVSMSGSALDITDRKRVEEALRTSQEKLRQALQASGTGLWDWNTTTKEVVFSDEWKQQVGYDPGELSDSFETWETLLHPDDHGGAIVYARAYLANPTGDYRQEFRLRHKDGTYRWIEARASLVTDTDGRQIRLLGSHTDITDRKATEEALSVALHDLRNVTETVPDIMYTLNLEGKVINWNKRGWTISGYSPDELLNRPALAFVPENERLRVEAALRQVFETGAAEIECHLLTKDGRTIPYHWTGAVLKDRNGRLIGMTGIGRDITALKQAEGAVRESEERYRTLVELSPSGVFVFCEGRTVYINRTGALLMGARDVQEILDRPTFDFIHPDYHQEVRENVNWLLSGGVSVHSAERVYLRMDGTPIPVQVEAGRIMWNGKPAILGLFSDITERKHTEEALANLNATLERQVSDRTEELRLSEERFRQFFEHAPSATSLKDQNGRYLYTNRRFNEVFGLSPGMVLGKRDDELFSPEQSEQFQSHDREVLTSGQSQEFEDVTQQQDGLHTSIVVKFPVTDASGSLSAIGSIATDITERKRTQEQLRLYREIFTHSIDGIAVIDLQGRYLQQNSAHERLLGYSTGELTGNTPAIHLGEEGFAHVGDALATAGSYRGEVESRTKSGAVLTLDLTAFVVTDAQGQPVCYVGIKRDITARNRAQTALRASEERLRLAMEAADLGSWDVNVQTGEAMWSRRHALMQGYAPDPGPVSIQRWKDRIHPDDLDRVMADVERAKAKQGLFSVEHRTVWSDGGEERWLSLYGRFFYDETGVPIRFSGVSIDITERNRAQEALRESEARWQQFAESVGSAFWIADITLDDRKVLYVNAAFTFIWGIEREEIYDNWSLWLDSIHPDDRLRVKTSHDRFVHGGTASLFHCEYRIVGRDGHIRWISDRRVRMAGWENRIAGIAEDITHHKQQFALMAQTEAIGKIGGWELDFLTNRLWWSDETYRLHETTPESYSPTVETALNFYTPESRPIIAEAWGKGVTQGQSWDLELELISMKGRRIAVRAAGKVDVLEGRAVRAYGTFQDITERKQAEAALRLAHDELERKVVERTAELQTSEERYRSLYDETPSMYFTVDRMGIIRSVNQYGARYLGYRVEDLVGKSVVAIIFEEDRARICAEMEAFFCHPDGIAQWEFRKVRGDGTVLWVCEFARVLQRQVGESLALIVCDDITERRHSGEALRESEERFAKAFRASLHPIGITEMATGRCIEVNDACLQLFGFHREEVIGQTTLLLGIWPHQEDRARLVERLKSGESVRNLEVSVRTKSGDLRHILVSSELAELNGTLCLITVGNDITEQKWAAEALQRSERDLRTVLDALPIGVWFTDRKGQAILSNPASQRIWNSARMVEWVSGGRTWTDSTEHTTGPHRWVLSQVLAHGEPSFDETFQLDCGDEGKKTILNTSVPVRGEDGTVLGAVVLNEDITDRVEAEEALRQNHALLSAIMDASVDLIYVKDLEGRYVHMNQAGALALGIPVQDVIGSDDRALWGCELADSCRDSDRRTIDSGETTTVEESGKVGGKTAYYLTTKAPYRDPEGRIIGVIGVSRDITERKQAEEALRASEERFAKAFQASLHPVVISEVDSGRVVDANDAAYQMFGYRKEEVMGLTTLQIGLWHSEEERARYLEVLKRQGAVRNVEVQLRSKHGAVRQCLLSSELIMLNGKQCSVTVGDDITERKRAEEELRRSHRFIRQIIDTDPNFIFAKDREGRFTLVNKAVADCYGTTVEELIGKSDADFNISRDEVQVFREGDLEVMNSAQDRFIPEEKITDAGGTTRWLQTVKRPIFDDHGEVRMVLGAATDITERKRMEEVLLQRERDLSTALQERERISQDLHDGILQSLYAIGLGLEACKPLIRRQPDDVAGKFMTTLDHAIGQLNQVMGELRNFIAGLESHVIQGGDFPTALRTMVRTMSGASSAHCMVRIEDAAARRLSTEQALHIINIVREGLSNALRHSRAKRVTVSLRELLRSVRLTITDDGIGFRTRSAQGVGHGLANMAARAQKVHGTFALRSKPFKGTKIVLDLRKDSHYAYN
jgi:PAS domain S-box-containing protein